MHPDPECARRRRPGGPALRRRQPQRLRRRHRRGVRRDRPGPRADAPPGEPRRRAASTLATVATRPRPTPSGSACSDRRCAMSPEPMPEPFVDIDLPLADRREGKVRVSYRLDSAAPTRLFVTTDRLSAFDRNIAGIPYKGQVLNQLAAWWFARTARHRRQPRRRGARPQRADRPRDDAAAGRGGRPRGDHRRHVDVAVAALRRRGTDDLRLPLPRRAA